MNKGKKVNLLSLERTILRESINSKINCDSKVKMFPRFIVIREIDGIDPPSLFCLINRV